MPPYLTLDSCTLCSVIVWHHPDWHLDVTSQGKQSTNAQTLCTTATGSLSAVRGHETGERSLNREQSNANAEGSAIVFLGDHQVKTLHIPSLPWKA